MSKKSIMDELMEEVQADQEKAGGSKTPVWKVPADKKDHAIRILPGNYGKSGARWYVPIAQHWVPSEEGDNNIPVLCLAQHFNKPCALCDAWKDWRDRMDELAEEISSAERDEQKELDRKLKRAKAIAKALSFRRAYLHNVVSREERTQTVRLFTAPKTVWEIIITGFSTSHNDGIDIFDPEEGHDFNVKRVSEQNSTTYSGSFRMVKSPLSDDPAEVRRLMESRIDLEAIVAHEPKASDIEAALDRIVKSGGSSGSPKSRSYEQEDAGPRSGRKKPAPADEDADERRGARRDDVERPRRSRDDDGDDRPRRSRREEEEERPRRSHREEEVDRPRRSPIDDDDDDLPVRRSGNKRDALLEQFSEDDDDDD